MIHRLVRQLSPDGVLVLEMGIFSAPRSDWVKVKRGIDERVFPTMLKLREVLADLRRGPAAVAPGALARKGGPDNAGLVDGVEQLAGTMDQFVERVRIGAATGFPNEVRVRNQRRMHLRETDRGEERFARRGAPAPRSDECRFRAWELPLYERSGARMADDSRRAVRPITEKWD